MARQARRLVTRRDREEEDVNPMQSVGNLVDIMLVFCCGLMIAIILFWQVNLKDLAMIMDQSQMIPVDNPEEVADKMQSISEFEAVGNAIRDPETGKIYTIKDEDAGDSGSASADSE